ncbi:MAG: hypothetical protein GX605_07930 [Chloroflexi bacterium]|nr:hypothetical protein [Chloroflexota bacterium]
MTVRAAVQAVDITPALGCPVQGWDYPRQAREMPLPLTGKVLLLDDGQRQAGLVTLDLFGLEAPWVARLRQRLARATGISPALWMIAASHTHSAPVTTSLALPAGSTPDAMYLQWVGQALAGAAQRAQQALEPVRLGWGAGQVRFPMNRRHVICGQVAWPPMANPEGPVDREVGVVRLEREDGRPLALLMNCACHASILGNAHAVHPDYPGVAQAQVQAALGGDAAAMFLLGCCGNVRTNFTEPSGRFDWRAGAAEAATAGEELAAEALRVWERIVAKPVEQLAVAEAHRTLSFRPGLPEPLPRVEAEFQGLRAGPLLALSVPAEVFAEIGLAVKAGLSQAPLLATCTNGFVGYVPTAEAIPLGGYEVHGWPQWWGYPGAFHPATGDLFREAMLEVAAALGAAREG